MHTLKPYSLQHSQRFFSWTVLKIVSSSWWHLCSLLVSCAGRHFLTQTIFVYCVLHSFHPVQNVTPASNQSSSLFCSGNLIPTYIANLFLCSNSVGLDRCVLSLDNFRAPTLVMALISVFFFEQGAHLILHCDIKLMYHSLLLNSVLQSPWPSSIASLFFFTHSHIPFL